MTAISKGVTIIHATGNSGAGAWSGDPDTIDLDNFTFGTNYIDFDVTQAPPKESIEYNVKTFLNGRQIKTPNGKRSTIVQLKGFCTTLAAAKLVAHWGANHSKYSDARQYLIIRLGAGTYWTFLDPDRVEREYCKGAGQFDADINAKKNGANTYFDVVGNFESVWDSGT